MTVAEIKIDVDEDRLVEFVGSIEAHPVLAQRCGLTTRIAAEEFAEFVGLKLAEDERARETELVVLIGMLLAHCGETEPNVSATIDGKPAPPLWNRDNDDDGDAS